MRVLVTRAEPDATRTAAALVARGHQPVVVPLQEIRPLVAPPFAAVADAVAVTSSNALRHADPAFLSAFRLLPCFAVGNETANAARRAGFGDVRTGPGDARGLGNVIASALPRGSGLAYLCGRKRKDALELALGEAGITVAALETYDTVDRVPEPSEIARAADANAVLVYSPGAARRLAAAFTGRLAGTRFVAISREAAAGLPDDWKKRTAIAAAPDEASMLRALATL
jgi:uroporphyrinogen-III synthase